MACLFEMMQNWDAIFKQYGYVYTAPQENVLKIVELFKKRGVRKVLDLGCGSGRHLLHLAEQGFETFGIDLSGKAIELAATWLKERGLRADIRVGSAFERLPYEDDFFDAIISVRVLNHGRIEDIRNAVEEMQRVLKPNGVIFIEARKDRKIRLSKKQSLTAKIIGPRVHVPLTGREKGIVHYQFNKAILRKEFKNFRVINFWTTSEGYYCLLGELKLQK